MATSERERQRLKQAAKRAGERDIQLHAPKELARRRDCIGDAPLFMRTYFGWIFSQPFTDSRKAMVDCIVHAARYGGDYAVAAGRGGGKSAIALFTTLWLDLRGETVLPLIIGKNQGGAETELDNLKRAICEAPDFADDFPEVCAPIIALEDWASAARKQTVAGHYTKIGWQKDCIFLPTIPVDVLQQSVSDWPDDEPSYALGQGYAVVGIDGKIRGFKRRNMRPRLAIFDDIDDRESARSGTQTADNRVAIDQDAIGLAGSGQRTSRAMLCTTINDTCIAAIYTAIPGWRGQRFKAITKMPAREDLRDEYIRMRQERKPGDPDARVANAFYLANRDDMERGGEVDNPYDLVDKPGPDGAPMEVSSLQHYFNLIADVKMDAFLCEWQNDPPKSDLSSTSGLTRELVRSRLSGFARRELPPDSPCITIGVDPGKFGCHRVSGAFTQGGGGRVIDYGIIEVTGTDSTDKKEVIEQAILRALMQFRDELLSEPYRDASGNPVNVSNVLIDCGYCQDAVVELCRRFGEPFRAAKGIGGGKFHRGTASPRRRVGNHWFAQPVDDRRRGGPWIHFQDADHWKRSVHDRFLTEPLDDEGRYRSGALTLFVPQGKRDHNTYSAHVLAEEWTTIFVQGKGDISKFIVHSSNNHFLDASALMLAAAEMSNYGIFVPPQRTVITKTPAEWIAESKVRR